GGRAGPGRGRRPHGPPRDHAGAGELTDPHPTSEGPPRSNRAGGLRVVRPRRDAVRRGGPAGRDDVRSRPQARELIPQAFKGNPPIIDTRRANDATVVHTQVPQEGSPWTSSPSTPSSSATTGDAPPNSSPQAPTKPPPAARSPRSGRRTAPPAWRSSTPSPPAPPSTADHPRGPAPAGPLRRVASQGVACHDHTEQPATTHCNAKPKLAA